MFTVLLLTVLFVILLLVASTWGKCEGRGGMIRGCVSVQRVGAGALGAGAVGAVSQLGGESGVSVIVISGNRSVGTSSRCSINKTWNESKTRPEV